ncbi:CobW family GTP-binding protein [Cupriavidus basilensis]
MIPQCEFIVLSGFLGSGKTTLLSAYLEAVRDRQVAVIVNDVGEVNIDGAVLAVQDGIPMATLSNGCVCCSMTNDLPYTIDALIRERRLSGKPAYDQIILECSGLSDPGGVMRSLSALSSLGMRVRVITTYAADQRSSSEDFPLMAQQVCAAHSVVLTRLDLVTPQKIVDAASEVKGMGPMARIIVEMDVKARALVAFEPVVERDSTEGAESKTDDPWTKHPRINVFSLRWQAGLPWEHISGWLENLVFYFDDRLLRTKGLVRLADNEMLLIQGVGQHFDTPRRLSHVNNDESALVVICRDASESEILELEPKIPGLEITSRRAGRSSIKFARPRVGAQREGAVL